MQEKKLPPPLPARRVASPDKLKQPGDFCWAESNGFVRHLWVLCPFCGQKQPLPVSPGSPLGWKWNGDLDAPTLTPSINFVSGHSRASDCRWQGNLTDGIWETLSPAV